jgi:hypothetical protein
MRVTRARGLSSLWLQCSNGRSLPGEEHMSDDAKLGLIVLFMVFALMVIGPFVAS